MKHFTLFLSFLFVFLISIVTYNYNPDLKSLLLQSSSLIAAQISSLSYRNITIPFITDTEQQQDSMLNTVKNTMTKTLSHAKITPHRSASRGHGDHGWLNTYHSFSFADWYNPKYNGFGALRVLNEDCVKANSGFPTHPHRDFEIFSYILSGELTHRDSMLKKGAEGGQSDRFYRMRRGDVQFTTGGTGIAHSEFNEHRSETVHFLQIWAHPWRRGLTPRYHTRHFDDADKRKGFVNILSPLKGGVDASPEQEKVAEPTLPDTIPIHADLVMAAGIIAPGNTFEWNVGAKATEASNRKVYVHVPMTKGGKARVRIDARDDAVLEEGDGAFVDGVNAGDKLSVESIGEAEAEVVVLDTA
ncbi:RmlC-like cupin domain-containing protein [Apodospora peruviana]|uniref:RmlC-like cupin domain-containing protein n=1 Tax=Apodospora peruviana TaxID=516989 RepID=A0AAE0MH92_9PEZI|nr:RmlC-like cupin domain-containing protein [Apodospora peruviana]